MKLTRHKVRLIVADDDGEIGGPAPDYERRAVPIPQRVRVTEVEDPEEAAGRARAEAALQALIDSRGISTNSFEYVLARRCVNLLAEGQINEFVRLYDQLPPRVFHASAPLADPAKARRWLWDAIARAKAADATEEIAALKREVASLRKQLAGSVPQHGGAPCADTGALGAPSPVVLAVPPVEGAPITPTDVMPPSERSDLPCNMVQQPGADDGKRPQPMLGRGPVIDAVPVKKPEASGTGFARPADATRAGEWDRSENARRWREWRAAGNDVDYLL